MIKQNFNYTELKVKIFQTLFKETLNFLYKKIWLLKILIIFPFYFITDKFQLSGLKIYLYRQKENSKREGDSHIQTFANPKIFFYVLKILSTRSSLLFSKNFQRVIILRRGWVQYLKDHFTTLLWIIKRKPLLIVFKTIIYDAECERQNDLLLKTFHAHLKTS